jgi:hypothetical protein
MIRSIRNGNGKVQDYYGSFPTKFPEQRDKSHRQVNQAFEF